MTEITIRELWDQTAAVLEDRPAARWLCEVATSAYDEEFTAALDEQVTQRMVAHLDSMLERFRTGEPLQYVLGRWGFRQLDLAIDSRVLIPRPETELVAETAIALASARGSPVTVADLGTGSGAIGLALADELPHAGTTVWITDVDADALDVARANLAGLGRAAVNVRVAHGSWFEPLPGDARFDVIVANPPYIADGSSLIDDSVHRWEPHLALFGGFDGLDHIRHLVSGAHAHLVPGGWLVLEIGADQGSAVRELLETGGYTDVEIRSDLAGHDRIALGRT
ncbi:MAG TPA: peptide chain release factor N(5)-glutamine methyltransferase [Ilumatobacteraceae bacterium]|nr:peptide chain release factor N(5)-glutamine methyltransferase [Ilumatobacteraceae bacterium]